MKTSPLCQLQMTLPGGFPGCVGGVDSADERWGTVAAGVPRDLAHEHLAKRAAA